MRRLIARNESGAPSDGAPPQAVHAFRITRIDDHGADAVVALTWSEAVAPNDAVGDVVWLHIDRSDAAARRWIVAEAGLSQDVVAALTEDDTQPRAATLDDGVLLVLRGPSRDASAKTERGEFERLVSLRVFATERRVISVRLRPFAATYVVAERLASGDGPRSVDALLEELIETASSELEQLLDRLGERIDALEELALAAPSGKLRERRSELNALKRATLRMRRYLAPQEAALHRLAAANVAWFGDEPRQGIREAGDRAARAVGDLVELRERASLVGEEMHARLQDRMNRTMVALAVVSTVFLPLTFTTGLLGVNLAGIPYAENPYAFVGFAVVLAAVALCAVLMVWRIMRL